MATQTLRPDATPHDSAKFARTGGTTKHGVVSDDSDATYLTADCDINDSDIVFSLGTYTLAAGERVARVRARVRGRVGATAGRIRFYLDMFGASPPAGDRAVYTTFDSGNLTASFAEVAGAWFDASAVGLGATNQQVGIDAHGAMLSTRNISGSAVVDIAEVYFDLDVWQAPGTPSPTPSGTVNDTDIPTVEWTATKNDGDPGTYTWVAYIYHEDDYTLPGWEVGDTLPAWYGFGVGVGETAALNGSVPYSSGYSPTSSSGAGATAPPVPLINGETYRVYVLVSKNNVGGTTPLSSDYGFATFTLSLTLPTAPTVAVVVDQTDGRQTITVTTPGALTHDTAEGIEVQRSDDGGTNWATIRDGTLDTFDVATAYTFHDYDAPRDTELLYRVRTVEGLTSSGTTIGSDWVTPSSVAHPLDGRWWLYDVDSWTRVVAGARISENPEEDIAQDVGVFRPPGRTTAVVVSGTVHGNDGSYAILATGSDDCDDLDTIGRYAGTVLVKSPFGWQRYVRWVARSRVVRGTPAEPKLTWTVGFVEVDDGIG
jgi:hypothetical protein